MGIFCSCSKLQENENNLSAFCKFCQTQFGGIGWQRFKSNQCKSHKNKNLHQLDKNNCTNDSVVSDDTKGDCQTSLSTFWSDIALADTNSFSDQNDVIDQPADSVPVENPEAGEAEVGVLCQYSIEDFELMKIIGDGTYATVFMVEHKRSQCTYAMKVIEKERAAKNIDINWVQNERNVFITVAECSFFVALHCCFQTTSQLFFVMEFVRGGDLLYFMKRKRRLTENHARFYTAEISLALNFLHTKGIIYRDLKLENVLLDHEGHIKLADYGLCTNLKWPGEKIDSLCGTANYIAPEIIRFEPYGFSVDWWALGIILYEMLVGKSPFDIKEVPPNEDYNTITFTRILYNPLSIPKYLSGEATCVLKGLLNKNAVDRLGCFGDVKDCPFFKSIDWKMLEQKKIQPNYIPQLDSDRDLTNFSSDFTDKPVHLKPDDQ
ncbi:atypical protein kinase C-like [Metopolophium dirhodum]|uniref:atypical protein kinase C-like n=1 Tax=Metopolophium dirhodum TaxID=44670 RepID=UPI0029903A7E|nr:atypical protein kinase C-like [Metopolophium dirhodum]